MKIPNKTPVCCTRDYICPKCGRFSVIHNDYKTRQVNCSYCGSKVQELVEAYEDCPHCGKYVSKIINKDRTVECFMCRKVMYVAKPVG